MLNEKEQNRSNENDESKEESNFSVENTIHNKDNDSSLYDYIEEEEEPGSSTIPTAQKVVVIGKKIRNK